MVHLQVKGLPSQKRVKTYLSLILVASLVGGVSRVEAATKIKFSEKKTVVKEIKYKSDIRLRHENFERSGGNADRQRQRIRFRAGLDIKLPHNIKVKSRLTTASGGDQVSGNQSFDNNASRKAFDLDLAFIEWKPWSSVKLQGGKVKNPFLKTGSTDLMFDGDYNPEGISQSIFGLVGPLGLFANLGQFVIEEVSGDTQDAYLFSEEGGVEVKLPAESRAKLSLAHHEFANIANNTIGGVDTLGTNTAGARFSIFQVNTVLSSWVFGVPVAVHGTYLQNMAAPKTTVGGALATADEQDVGVHAGIQVGKAKKKGQAHVAYFYKELEMDAAVAGITDSDMPNITNTKGHIFIFAYKITDFIKAQIKHWDAESKVVAAGTADNSTNRTQFDLSMKF